MRFKKSLICFVCVLCSFSSFGQIKISEFAKQNDNALYFVDYWVT
jgi:hypothetical protein